MNQQDYSRSHAVGNIQPGVDPDIPYREFVFVNIFEQDFNKTSPEVSTQLSKTRYPALAHDASRHDTVQEPTVFQQGNAQELEVLCNQLGDDDAFWQELDRINSSNAGQLSYDYDRLHARRNHSQPEYPTPPTHFDPFAFDLDLQGPSQSQHHLTVQWSVSCDQDITTQPTNPVQSGASMHLGTLTSHSSQPIASDWNHGMADMQPTHEHPHDTHSNVYSEAWHGRMSSQDDVMDGLQPTQGPSKRLEHPASACDVPLATPRQELEQARSSRSTIFGAAASSSGSHIPQVPVANPPSDQVLIVNGQRPNNLELAATSLIVLKHYLMKTAPACPGHINESSTPAEIRRYSYRLYMEECFDNVEGIAVVNPGKIHIGDIGQLNGYEGVFKRFHNLKEHNEEEPLPPGFLKEKIDDPTNDSPLPTYNCTLRSRETSTKLPLSMVTNGARVMLSYDGGRYCINVSNRKELETYARLNGPRIYAKVKGEHGVDVEDGELLMVVTAAGWKKVTQFISVSTRKKPGPKWFNEDIDIPAPETEYSGNNCTLNTTSEDMTQRHIINRFGWDKLDDVQVTHINVIPLPKTHPAVQESTSGP